jgi:hypothetical protein
VPIKPQFLFTHYRTFYRVKVLNLEKLEVEQIQQIERFVQTRNGIFDFESYSFDIQKRLEFYEFEHLISKTQLNALCSENIVEKKTQPRISFGQYKGMLLLELPDSYLIWLLSNYRGSQRDEIESEIKRRKL